MLVFLGPLFNNLMLFFSLLEAMVGVDSDANIIIFSGKCDITHVPL